MREIKFRGKRLYAQKETTKYYAEDKGVWKYGTYTYAHKYRGGEHGYLINDIYGRPIMCDEKTIGQFTGLLDKNDVEIYCGDKVQHGDSSVIVMWDEQYCMFVFKDGSVLNKHHQKHYEVIGNIHTEEIK